MVGSLGRCLKRRAGDRGRCRRSGRACSLIYRVRPGEQLRAGMFACMADTAGVIFSFPLLLFRFGLHLQCATRWAMLCYLVVAFG